MSQLLALTVLPSLIEVVRWRILTSKSGSGVCPRVTRTADAGDGEVKLADGGGPLPHAVRQGQRPPHALQLGS